MPVNHPTPHACRPDCQLIERQAMGADQFTGGEYVLHKCPGKYRQAIWGIVCCERPTRHARLAAFCYLKRVNSAGPRPAQRLIHRGINTYKHALIPFDRRINPLTQSVPIDRLAGRARSKLTSINVKLFQLAGSRRHCDKLRSGY